MLKAQKAAAGLVGELAKMANRNRNRMPGAEIFVDDRGCALLMKNIAT